MKQTDRTKLTLKKKVIDTNVTQGTLFFNFNSQ